MTHQIYLSKNYEQKVREGLLGVYLDELTSFLLQKGYPKRYIRPRLAVIVELNDWLIQKNIRLRNLSELQIKNFIQHRSKQTAMADRGEIITLDFFLTILRSHKCIPLLKPEKKTESEIDKLMNEYKQYLIEERGLSHASLHNFLYYNRYFLSNLFGSKYINLNRICVQDITKFMREYTHEHSHAVNSMMMTCLRSFFRFLLIHGKVLKDLSKCVLAVPNRKHNRIPQYLSAKELSQLLEYSKGETPLKIRNYAILLLLVLLGFRAIEVVRLSLDDIDWKYGEIIIRGKGARQTRFPLPVDMGKALVSYLKNGRPSCSTRRFFVSSKAPVQPFKNQTAISSIVSRCITRAGLNPPKKGAHLLRHTLATEYLRKGATLAEIGEILRHKHIDTTAIYAKVDFTRLHTIAQPWPDSSIMEV